MLLGVRMIKRDISDALLRFATQYPVVTITGPRQSGKTTLVRHLFKDRPYYNLENLASFEFAKSDPIGFLDQMPDGGVIDEIQKVPELLGQIQVICDEKQQNGLFILTGSSQLELSDGVAQSLAGRTALITLLPLSVHEIKQDGFDINEIHKIHTGFLPRIISEDLDATEALDFYYRTYVERDVRNLLNVQNVSQFQLFVKMCAGRVGQLLNLSSLANDVGISHTTARHWMSILQACYIVFVLPPWFENLGKRLVKSPKLYFYDVGLAAFLMGIEHPDQVRTHPLFGSLFENLVICEFLKFRCNLGKTNNLHFFRDSKGNEVDIILQSGQSKMAVEIKAGKTIQPSFYKGLRYAESLWQDQLVNKWIVYGGEQKQKRTDATIIPVSDVFEMMSSLRSS